MGGDGLTKSLSSKPLSNNLQSSYMVSLTEKKMIKVKLVYIIL